MNSIKLWLKEQILFILRGLVPLLCVIIFALFAVTWLPEKTAMNLIWIFVTIVGLYILLSKRT
jgi:hypothetical protein